MRLADLVDTSRRVSETSSRLEKIATLAELLRRLRPAEVEIAVSFLSGSTQQGRIGVGWSTIRDVRATAAAEHATLEIADVDEAFGRIAAMSGPGSSREKVRTLAELFSRATRDEQEFLARLLFGELRQGALEGVLLDAVARASGVENAVIRRAAMMAGDLGAVARAALEHGTAGLSAFSIRLFQPVQPMLAETADTTASAVRSLGKAALEYKMDGARIQVHKAGDDVRIFTRNLRDVSAAAPEVVEAVKALPARELILDGEVIALTSDRTPHPFQVTMRRFGRKLDVDRLRQELPLSAFFFDCLYVDGQTLVDEPQAIRFAALSDAAPASIVIPHAVADTVETADAFLRSALDDGHEGVMAKSLEAGYAAGRRGAAWLKLKVARTLDLVVLAAEWGHGRRTGWLSNLHLGARDPVRNSFVMLGKTFKGMTDQMLEWQTRALLDLEMTRDDYTVYVRPELVVEVAFNDVQASPVYPGGLALRFARIKRYRTDKSAADTDTFETVQRIHRGQLRTKN
jgi:DNA ligase-1